MRDANRSITAELVIEQVVRVVYQHPCLCRIHLIESLLRQTPRGVFHSGERRKRSFHFCGVVKRLSLASDRVYFQKPRKRISIAADDSVMHGVFQPARTDWRAAKVDALLRIENVVDGELLGLRDRLNRDAGNNEN